MPTQRCSRLTVGLRHPGAVVGTEDLGARRRCGGECAFDAFFRAFGRLSSIQFAQFVLMNGIHRGGPFHALAALFGLLDFDGYKYWRTREFQASDEAPVPLWRGHGMHVRFTGLE